MVATALVPATVLYIVRHGDRFDYGAGRTAWKERCARTGVEKSDPPLSALGHSQARDVAARMAVESLNQIVVSPYLRALQTAQYTAHATGLELCVDFAAAELHQNPSVIPRPTSTTRLAHLPEISESYQPMLSTVVVGKPGDFEPGVEPRLEHMRRMLWLAKAFTEQRFRGPRVATFTHGASLALVAALLGAPTLANVGRFAPCGVIKVVRSDVDSPWECVEAGDDNTAYVSANSDATPPWGFEQSACPIDEIERNWKEACRLGPTNLDDLRAREQP